MKHDIHLSAKQIIFNDKIELLYITKADTYGHFEVVGRYQDKIIKKIIRKSTLRNHLKEDPEKHPKYREYSTWIWREDIPKEEVDKIKNKKWYKLIPTKTK